MNDRAPGLAPEHIQPFRHHLTVWYLNHRRDLPWRQTTDPYRIWVSEVMLQQTQVKTVIDYYHRFLQRFPAIEILAGANRQEVLKCWEGLGYYARARHLHEAARIVTDTHHGRVPDDHAAFRRLPGVGEYIAAAVQSIAFGAPYAVVDGNVKRVLARLLCMETPVNISTGHKVFKAPAEMVLDKSNPGRFNQAMMELGALVCRPDTPLCPACPVSLFCRSHRTRMVAVYPRRKKARAVPTRHIAVGVVCRNGKMLITRRKPDGLLGGLWEFPGGKIHKKETPAAACRREIHEETGLSVQVSHLLARVNHAYTHFKVKMEVFICRHISGKVRLNGPVAHRWISVDELEDYPFPKANHKFFIPLETAMRAMQHE